MASKKVSKKQYPKNRPKALYAYVSRKAFKHAHDQGNVSEYVDTLILGTICKRKPQAKALSRK